MAMAKRINQDVGRLLKEHKDAEARALLELRESREYPDTFPGYMTDRLKEKGVKRKELAERMGVSPGYLYKVLSGSKKTVERDYIIAMCVAAGFTVEELENALRLYPMMPLDGDVRGSAIKEIVASGTSLYDLNDGLDRMGYPVLRVTRDMEQGGMIPVRGYSMTPQGRMAPAKPVTEGLFVKETKCEVWHEIGRRFPLEYNYMGEITLETAGGETKYVQVAHACDFTAFSVGPGRLEYGYSVDKESEEFFCTYLIEEEMGGPEAYERWLEEDGDEEGYVMRKAEKSAYFPYYLKLEYLTDQLAAEVAAGTAPPAGGSRGYHWTDENGDEYYDGICLRELVSHLRDCLKAKPGHRYIQGALGMLERREDEFAPGVVFEIKSAVDFFMDHDIRG